MTGDFRRRVGACEAPGRRDGSVATVKSPCRPSALVFAAGAAAFAVTMTACSSGVVPSSEAQTPVAATGCPTVAPEDAGTPEWTLPGATGSVEVMGSSDEAAPLVSVIPPFTVTETQVHTLQAGAGPIVADTATVSVCYMGVNGRDGSVFDSSYQRGAPVEFPLDGVVPGFQKAIAGQNVGSTVAVAMTSADGYPQGQPGTGILPGDSLIFAIKILNASQ